MKSLNQRYYSCFFTGHRIIGDKKLRDILYKETKEKIRFLIEEKGVDTFICGGAVGFDALAACAVIETKELYPDIRLVIYIPCYKHYAKWNSYQIDEWKKITRYADDAIYITHGTYRPDCMKKRNKAMADNAHYCIAFCIKRNSGTGMTIAYAQEINCEIYNTAEYI